MDELAHELVQTTFDAVERDGIRAEWDEEGSAVIVTDLARETAQRYNGEDLVRAESDREVSNAREPA